MPARVLDIEIKQIFIFAIYSLSSFVLLSTIDFVFTWNLYSTILCPSVFWSTNMSPNYFPIQANHNSVFHMWLQNFGKRIWNMSTHEIIQKQCHFIFVYLRKLYWRNMDEERRRIREFKLSVVNWFRENGCNFSQTSREFNIDRKRIRE